jgi:deoxyribodipyrimidine photolyase-related protein
VGAVDGFDLAVTRSQAEAAFEDFIANRLGNFGAYEDAMSSSNPLLFHSLLSPYMNLGLLDPLEMARRVEDEFRQGRTPLNSAEGFIRQIIGWREYIYWSYWRLMPDLLTANAWGHTRPLPRFFWDGDTEMACLRRVIERVIASGYSHHIERLMVLCNFCLLAGVNPAAVNDWFLTFYIDAYEWVVTPNVIGMGLNADGGQTATKPYIASANYINKMSDYCRGCRFSPAKRTGEDACPFNFLYWNFLLEHEATLRSHPRFGPAVLGVGKIDAGERAAIREQAAAFLDTLESYITSTPSPSTT